MSLKLIREAQLRTTISADEVRMLELVKEATGAASIVDLVNESFTPSAEDYDAWMRVIVGEAQDRGINISKRRAFIELAMDMLENDPANPPLDMQEMIANKLWQDFQSAKHEVRIQNVAKAKEEEEKVEAARKQIASRYSQGPSTSTTTSNPSAYDEEEMGISDELAAKKIFAKIQGTPNLSFVNVERMVARYLPMVGKSQSDVKYIASLVYDKLQNVGMEEEEVDDWVRNGGKIQQIAARKPRTGEKWQGSAHIGKGGDGRGAHKVTTGKAANTMGKRVIGLSKVGMEDEESGFEQAVKMSQGIEDEEGGMSFLDDVIKGGSGNGMSKGSFSAHLRGDDNEDPDAEFELINTLDKDGNGDLSDDEVFTSTDDECECPCDDDMDSESELDNEEDLDDESELDDEDTSEFADTEFDDNTMDDIDADVKRKVPVEKSYDEEEAVKSFFRQAVTSPRNMLTQAVKDIEEEGKAAWKKANVPSNPHPQKSQAFRAWQKGMMAAAKEALGIVDKATPVKKPKRKK